MILELSLQLLNLKYLHHKIMKLKQIRNAHFLKFILHLKTKTYILNSVMETILPILVN